MLLIDAVADCMVGFHVTPSAHTQNPKDAPADDADGLATIQAAPAQVQIGPRLDGEGAVGTVRVDGGHVEGPACVKGRWGGIVVWTGKGRAYIMLITHSIHPRTDDRHAPPRLDHDVLPERVVAPGEQRDDGAGGVCMCVVWGGGCQSRSWGTGDGRSVRPSQRTLKPRQSHQPSKLTLDEKFKLGAVHGRAAVDEPACVGARAVGMGVIWREGVVSTLNALPPTHTHPDHPQKRTHLSADRAPWRAGSSPRPPRCRLAPSPHLPPARARACVCVCA